MPCKSSDTRSSTRRRTFTTDRKPTSSVSLPLSRSQKRFSATELHLGEYHFSGIPAGEYYIRAALGARPAGTTGVAVRANNAAPTYYPGVTSPDEAVSIKVTGGVDLHTIDFTLAPVSPIKVSGR